MSISKANNISAKITNHFHNQLTFASIFIFFSVESTVASIETPF